MQFDLDLGAIESEEGPKCLYEAAISKYYARYIYGFQPIYTHDIKNSP